jgi:SAM-dependent methyltransferase
VSFASQEEFTAFCHDNRALLDSRFRYERNLANGEATLTREGSCATCLSVARFTTHGVDGPDWRDGQICDCTARISHRARAMLHFLQARTGLNAASRLAFIGPPAPLESKLGALQSPPVTLARLLLAVEAGSDAVYRLDAEDGAFDIAVCWDYLQRIPPLAEALLEIRRVLAPGGWFVFSLPFHYLAAETITRLGHVPRRAGRLPPEFRGEINEIGWDILDMLRSAGFARAQVHHYWSDELGYLGAFNLLLSACA